MYGRGPFLPPPQTHFSHWISHPIEKKIKKIKYMRERENRRLVADEPVEFEKEPVEVHQGFRRIADRARGNYRI